MSELPEYPQDCSLFLVQVEPVPKEETHT